MAKSKSAKKKSKASKSNDHPVTASSSSQPSVPQSSTSQLPSISSHNVSLDDMAMELLAAKEVETEVKELQKEVARLKKEIEFKDAIIARLQAQSGTRTHTEEQGTVSTPTSTPSFSSPTSKPAATDTVDHIQSKLAKMETLLHPNDASLQCTICVEHFSSPFTAECGHTFCYTCLHSWLEIHKNCPTCRTKLLRRPTLSFIIQQQVHASVARLPEPERSVVQEKLQEDEKSVKRIQSRGDLWEGIFKPLDLRISSTIMDVDDDVRRCPACGWEVINGVCEGCRTPYSDVEDSDESQENTDAESEPDVYDSNDSFINDDEDEDEDDDDNNNNDSESDNGSQVSSQDIAKEIDRLKHSTLEVSSGSESSEGSDAAEETATEDEVSDDQEVKKPRRRISRRAIVISDDEEDDKDKRHDRDVSASTATKAVNSKSCNKRSEESSDSDSSEDDDFVSAPKRRTKKPRSGNMEALFK